LSNTATQVVDGGLRVAPPEPMRGDMPTLQTKSLYIAAGHSHSDTGAVGNGHTEADIVLAFRDAMADELRNKVVFAKDGERGQNLR